MNEPLRKFAYLLLFVIVGSAVTLRWDAIWAQLFSMVTAASMLLVLALFIGVMVSKVCFEEKDDQYAVMTEFGVRNLALGTAVGLGFQGNFASVGPAAVYLFIEGIVLLTAAYARRTNTMADGNSCK